MKMYATLALMLCLMGCNSSKKANRLYGDKLFQSWVHAHEESAGDTLVFRPANYPLPLSRNREGFEIRQDGSFQHTLIGKRDYPEEMDVSWKLKNKRIVIESEDPEYESFSLEIVELAPDRLAVKKHSDG